MSGTPETVIRTLTSAAADLKWVFEERLDVQLAADKATTFASNASVAQRLARKLARYCPSVPSNAVVSLGCDLAPGQRRACKGGLLQRKTRFQSMRKRHGFIKYFRKKLPRDRSRMGKIYISGVRPGAGYGSMILGMSDKELAELRTVLLSGFTAGASRCIDHRQGLYSWRSRLASGNGSCEAVGVELLAESDDPEY